MKKMPELAHFIKRTTCSYSVLSCIRNIKIFTSKGKVSVDAIFKKYFFHHTEWKKCATCLPGSGFSQEEAIPST